MKRILFTIGATLGLTLIITSPAHAASACDFTTAIKQLSDASTQTEELAGRKALLTAIAECSKEEISEAESALAEIDITESSLETVRERLEERLIENRSRAEDQKARIEAVGLRGTRDIAQTIKEWRVNTHLPTTANVANLSLWERNQKLLTTANDRAKQISQTVKSLKLKDREEIKTAIESAYASLDAASESHASAKRKLETLNNPAEIAVDIRNSLDELSRAYEAFFRVSEEVKKILPL